MVENEKRRKRNIDKANMKTLSEIIDEVDSGGRPEYDELRYALIAMKALHHFDSKAIRNLYQREKDGKYRPELFGLKYASEESFRRFKTALGIPPKQYVGPDHDPDTEECQRWRKLSLGLLNKVMK